MISNYLQTIYKYTQLYTTQDISKSMHSNEHNPHNITNICVADDNAILGEFVSRGEIA